MMLFISSQVIVVQNCEWSSEWSATIVNGNYTLAMAALVAMIIPRNLRNQKEIFAYFFLGQLSLSLCDRSRVWSVGFRSCGIPVGPQGTFTLSLTRSFALSLCLPLGFGWESWTKLIWFAGLPFRRFAQCKVLFIHRSLHLEEPPLRFRFRFGFSFSFWFGPIPRAETSDGTSADVEAEAEAEAGAGAGAEELLASSYYLAN